MAKPSASVKRSASVKKGGKQRAASVKRPASVKKGGKTRRAKRRGGMYGY